MPPLQVHKIGQLTGHKASVFALAPGDSSQFFYSGAGDGWLVRWNLEDPEMGRLVAKVDTQIFSLLYLPEFNKMVVGNMNGGVHWVNLNDPANTRNIAHHEKGVFDILQIGNQVFTIGGEGKISRWSPLEGQSLESLHLSNQSLRSADYSPQRDEIAIGASDNNIYLLDAKTLTLKHTIKNAHANSVFTVKYGPNGRHLLSGGRDAQLKVWDARNEWQRVLSHPAHWFTINDIAFHPDGQKFATASRDKTIKIWDAKSFDLLKVLETVRDRGHINSVNNLYWSDYENYLISCGDDRSIIVWKVG